MIFLKKRDIYNIFLQHHPEVLDQIKNLAIDEYFKKFQDNNENKAIKYFLDLSKKKKSKKDESVSNDFGLVSPNNIENDEKSN